MTPEEIRELIRENVFDPELGYNVVDLGLLYDVEVRDEKNVRVEMTLTTVGCPLYDVMQQDVERTIKTRYGDDVHVGVEFVFDPPWNPEMMSEEIRAEMGFI
ncbi:iron-sulfur cluster assembly protein [Candidatus Acetothermia bacterium]|jgi:metal-sulfur cluster biosynthetic enzyme|nr:iron-sulfur cluster assembly protein [Candidatus Acetothermia bacterium]MCI2431861.1 iron-sulfur cluster assembly protein [Candidatus Acetothermia bacterium]MCI2435972.1 iron-sulfur cluster assembly protein [Candidatus Acetothermia bacterium]